MNFNQEKSHSYTIDDVARELGISKTTVSRAISGKGRISAETREKVLNFIQEHNYRPNAVAKSLAQSRTYNLSIVLPNDYSATEPAFFQSCMSGICQIASENDYDVLLSMVKNQNTNQLERVIRNQKVDGVIVTRSRVNSPVVALLKKWNIPFVVIGPSPDPDVPCVDNNNEEACRDLTGLLLAKGMQKMALFGGDDSHYVTHCRQRGFEEAHYRAKKTLHPELIFLNVDTAERTQKAVDEAIRLGADCIVCMDDFICSLVMIQLRTRGVHIPQDIKLASFYDSTLLEQYNPPVTSLKFDAEKLGQTVCRMMLDQLNGVKNANIARMGYQVVFRESTK